MAKKEIMEKITFDMFMENVPEQFTPAFLNTCFDINDGGKTVRRHLRAKFVAVVEHEHRDTWKFTKNGAKSAETRDMLEWFWNKYGAAYKMPKTTTGVTK